MAVEHGTSHSAKEVQELTQKQRLEQFAEPVKEAVKLITRPTRVSTRTICVLLCKTP